MTRLKRCPCGTVPGVLLIEESSTSKWAWVCGECCGEWNVEFRTQYHAVDSDKCMDLAVDAWNAALRDKLFDRVKDLEELVSHCWVHSGYENCGYRKMTEEQKKLFDSLTIDYEF